MFFTHILMFIIKQNGNKVPDTFITVKEYQNQLCPKSISLHTF